MHTEILLPLGSVQEVAVRHALRWGIFAVDVLDFGGRGADTTCYSERPAVLRQAEAWAVDRALGDCDTFDVTAVHEVDGSTLDCQGLNDLISRSEPLVVRNALAACGQFRDKFLSAVREADQNQVLMMYNSSALTTLAESRRLDDCGGTPVEKLRLGDALSGSVPGGAYLAFAADLVPDGSSVREAATAAITASAPCHRWSQALAPFLFNTSSEYLTSVPGTTMHADFPDNWFLQLEGERHWLLAHPRWTPYMRSVPKTDFATRSGAIDSGAAQFRNRTFEVAFHETVKRPNLRRPQSCLPFQEVVIGPGDALFQPAHWWHQAFLGGPGLNLAVAARRVSSSALTNSPLTFLERMARYPHISKQLSSFIMGEKVPYESKSFFDSDKK